tara:strand:+ start:1006 stop:1938 length:933 start_codon:yes stop_codon:yes gene_type:complete
MTDIQGSEGFQIPADANILASAAAGDEPVTNDISMPEPDAPAQPMPTEMEQQKMHFIRGAEANQVQLPEGVESYDQMFDIAHGLADAPGTVEEVKTEGDLEIPGHAEDAVEVPEEVDKLEVEDPESKEATIRKKMDIAEQWDTWGKELQENMTLSDASRQKIKDTMGVPDAVIDAYVTGFKAETQKSYNEAASIVGSQDMLNDVLKWASTTMTAEQRGAANQQLSGPNREIYLTGLVTQYERANPTQTAKTAEPQRRKPGATAAPTNPTPQVEAFPSEQHMVAAMRDPRYASDPNYQALVQARLAVTFNK